MKRRLQNGDVFSIPIAEDKFGYGQVIVKGSVFYIVVFRGTSPDVGGVSDALGSEIELCGWTLDGLIHVGHWVVLGNFEIRRQSVPMPSYKVLINGEFFVESFDKSERRVATSNEVDFLDYRSTIAPIIFEDAIKSTCGHAPWEDLFESITARYAKAREVPL